VTLEFSFARLPVTGWRGRIPIYKRFAVPIHSRGVVEVVEVTLPPPPLFYIFDGKDKY